VSYFYTVLNVPQTGSLISSKTAAEPNDMNETSLKHHLQPIAVQIIKLRLANATPR